MSITEKEERRGKLWAIRFYTVKAVFPSHVNARINATRLTRDEKACGKAHRWLAVNKRALFYLDHQLALLMLQWLLLFFSLFRLTRVCAARLRGKERKLNLHGIARLNNIGEKKISRFSNSLKKKKKREEKKGRLMWLYSRILYLPPRLSAVYYYFSFFKK